MKPTGFRGIYREDELARAVYAEGAGIAQAIPTAVAVPSDADDVATLVRWARASRVPLVPRGSGSGMAGGAVGTGTIVDLSRIDWIGDVDAAERRLWTGAGAVRAAVNERARRLGLRFPVDPSSGAFCTVGGMTATNAAGAHSLRYGATRVWVNAVDCVFEDGSRAVIRRGDELPEHVPAIARFVEQAYPAIRMAQVASLAHFGVRKNSSGYALAEYVRSGDLVDLLVGSEGTLAIITAVELRLLPVAAATSSVLASFATVEQAVSCANRAREMGVSACELLDRTFLDVAASGGAAPGLPPGTEAVLLIEVEGEDADDAAVQATALDVALTHAGASLVRVALDPATEHALWALRHAASPILSQLDPTLRSMQFIEDGAVPPRRLAEYVRGLRGALEVRGIRGVIFGHAGDAHVHVNPLIDVSSPDWRDRVRGLLEDVTALNSRLGGTLAGEHGDGRLRTPLLAQSWGATARTLFGQVKRCFDPSGILNPGVKIPLAGQRAIDAVKYDPQLPPLPARARAALDQVDRSRGWASFRLALIGEDAR